MKKSVIVFVILVVFIGCSLFAVPPGDVASLNGVLPVSVRRGVFFAQALGGGPAPALVRPAARGRGHYSSSWPSSCSR